MEEGEEGGGGGGGGGGGEGEEEQACFLVSGVGRERRLQLLVNMDDKKI